MFESHAGRNQQTHLESHHRQKQQIAHALIQNMKLPNKNGNSQEQLTNIVIFANLPYIFIAQKSLLVLR